ncbi:MAG: VWA domain-containing protein [Candidatus Brocadiae bacterium]|nr:VWA domain-containing protein [Candidatus Brocadiia bacterium]
MNSILRSCVTLTWALRLATFAAAILVCAASLPAQDPAPGIDPEFAAREDLKQARRQVEMWQEIRREHAKRRDAAVAPAAQAGKAYETARAERELADRIDSALRNPEANPSDKVKRLLAHIKSVEDDLERLRTTLKERPGHMDTAMALGATANYLERLYAKRDGLLNGTGEERVRREEWKKAAAEVAQRKFDAYWDARGTWYRASNELASLQRLVDADDAELAKAEAALLALEVDVLERFRNAPRPHLQRASASAGGAVVYDASWVSEEEVLDERIRFMSRAVIAQAAEIGVQTRRRDNVLDEYIAASNEAIAAIQAYESAIWTQAYRQIGIDLLDCAVSLALDAKDGGVAGLAVGTGVELAHKLYEWGSGDVGRRYDLPASGAAGPPPAHDPTTYVGEAGKEAIKSAIKAGLKGFIEGTRAGAADYRRLNVAQPLIEELWVVLKRRVIFNNRVTEEAIVVVFRKTSETLIVRSMKDRVKGAMNAFREGLKKGLVDAKVLRSIGRSMAQAAVKNFIQEMARSERLQAWYEFAEKDAIALEIYRQMRQESNLLQFEKLQLEAYQEYLRELMAERARLSGTRRLRFDRDEAVPATARAGDGSVELDLRLSFSRPVETVRVKVNGAEIVGSIGATEWSGKARLAAGIAEAALSVEAVDSLSRQGIDADPHTVPQYNTGNDRWSGWERGPDNTHTVRLGERKPGVSIVLLIDCSGSMGEHGRLNSAKTAARNVLNPDSLGPDDDVALWTFSGSEAQLRVPFTSDPARVVAAVDALGADGATPLALGISRSGDYLLSVGRNRKKVLIVLSDGEETMNGNPFEAMRLLRERGAVVREGGR